MKGGERIREGSFTMNQNMHVDLHEHGCKEQAVTDDICREIDRNYTVVLSIALSILCNLMHAVPRSECFF